jgi:carboxymethylenebutenolidase
MCDEFTAQEEEAALAKAGLSRRQFAALAAATAVVGCSKASRSQAPNPDFPERMVEVKNPDGSADAFLVHPAKGAHPGIVMWPDIAGLRDAFKTMARRLAAQGYAVLAVNQYYRSGRAPLLDSFAGWRTPEGQAKLQPMIAAIDPAGTKRDAAAFVAFLDTLAPVDKARGIGTSGYCMGGPFAVRTAAAAPNRVGAVASLHGANLVSDDADSPVKIIGATRASYLFAIGRNDDARSPGDKDALKAACAAAHRPAEIEVYPADHGWCVPDTPMYDKEAAERAWGRMLALFQKL